MDYTQFPIPAADLATLSGPDLAAFQAALAVAGVPVLATVRVSSAQLLALSTTPVSVAPAPGAGFKILPIAPSFEYNFLTAAYTSLGNPDLYYGTSSGVSVGAAGVLSSIDGTTSSETITAMPKAQAASQAACENMPLVFTDTQSWTGGAGSLVINIVYVIVPVT